tara:strand:- start:868 stop:1332 length:465 start_codon:yes stop_codon:yes gene_type:complete
MSLLKIHTINDNLIDWRKNKIKIVFTNGCFDLLHQGHIDLLNKAYSFGDILIVGLNSDSSVKKLKGENRPYENERIRSNNLLNLQFVNHVIIFNNDTPQDLVNIIMPDVLVKGGDYNVNNIVGAKEVISNGGRVEIVPLTDGYSTSSIIKSKNR